MAKNSWKSYPTRWIGRSALENAIHCLGNVLKSSNGAFLSNFSGEIRRRNAKHSRIEDSADERVSCKLRFEVLSYKWSKIGARNENKLFLNISITLDLIFNSFQHFQGDGNVWEKFYQWIGQ